MHSPAGIDHSCGESESLGHNNFFAFDNAYANQDGSEKIKINLSTPGCEGPFNSRYRQHLNRINNQGESNMKHRKTERGQSLVELAISLVVLLFSYVFYTAMTQAGRSEAR